MNPQGRAAVRRRRPHRISAAETAAGACAAGLLAQRQLGCRAAPAAGRDRSTGDDRRRARQQSDDADDAQTPHGLGSRQATTDREREPMRLYDATSAPNPRRVRVFVVEKGLDAPMVQVDLNAKGEPDARPSGRRTRSAACRCSSSTTGRASRSRSRSAAPSRGCKPEARADGRRREATVRSSRCGSAGWSSRSSSRSRTCSCTRTKWFKGRRPGAGMGRGPAQSTQLARMHVARRGARDAAVTSPATATRSPTSPQLAAASTGVA